MGKFSHALPGLHFGKFTPTMLVQQGRDQRGLQENNGGDQRDLPRITLPRRWLPKQDFASRWQAALADVTALKYSPIVFRRWTVPRRALDAPRCLTPQHPDGGRSRRSGALGRC